MCQILCSKGNKFKSHNHSMKQVVNTPILQMRKLKFGAFIDSKR